METRTEARDVSQGVYVNKVAKGQKYWFVNVSVPLEWLRLELSYEEFARQPGQLHRIFARAFNEAFQGAKRAERSVPVADLCPNCGFPGEHRGPAECGNPFDSVRGDGE